VSCASTIGSSCGTKPSGGYGFVKIVYGGSAQNNMKVCPKCQSSTRESERIETERKSKKSWLITFCARCGFNYDLQLFDGDVKSPEQEMEKYDRPTPPSPQRGYWI
jgi:hypothetical protein